MIFFLHLRPGSSSPPGIFNKSDLYCKRAWRQAQYLADVFGVAGGKNIFPRSWKGRNGIQRK